MTYGSVCSGIEAATCAWRPLGWTAAWFSEIDPFCSTLLQHHYKDTPNHGDFTTIGRESAGIDLLVGGTPCQDFSIAGLRAGLDGARGNLTLEYLKLTKRLRPRWFVWENVPGVLSIDGGRTFGTFLAGLAELGYGFAYRVLDAQYFGVPQRRRRVFVVGYLGDWRYPASVLFERESMSGDPAPSRKTGEGFTHEIAGCIRGSGTGTARIGDATRQDNVVASFVSDLAYALNAHGGDGRMDSESETFIAEIYPTLNAGGNETGGHRFPGTTVDTCESLVAHTLRGEGSEDGTGRSIPLVPTAFQECVTGVREYETAGTLRANGPGHDPVGTRLRIGWAVRRLTPRECERLQGFPDYYTLVPYHRKPAADGPRYKALGNSMAVPVMNWLGSRIDKVEKLIEGLA